MEKAKKKNITEICYMTSILTCLVVLIHTGSEAFNYYEQGTLFNILIFIYQKIMSFAVPGFIFLSSFKYFYNKKEDFSTASYIKFMHKKIVKIFVPYALVALVYYLYFTSKGYMSFDLKELIFGIFIRGDIASPFYFIIVIFQFYILMPMFSKFCKKNNFKLAILASILINAVFKLLLISNIYNYDSYLVDIYIRYNDRIFLSYIAYWTIGIYFGLFYEDLKQIIVKNKTIVNVIYGQVALAHIVLSYLNYRGDIYYKYAEIGHIIFCIASIIFIYKNSLILENLNIDLIRTISIKYSNISYFVYLVHVLIIYIMDELMNSYNIEKVYFRWIIRTITVFVFSGVIANILSSIKFKRRSSENLVKKLRY